MTLIHSSGNYPPKSWNLPFPYHHTACYQHVNAFFFFQKEAPFLSPVAPPPPPAPPRPRPSALTNPTRALSPPDPGQQEGPGGPGLPGRVAAAGLRAGPPSGSTAVPGRPRSRRPEAVRARARGAAGTHQSTAQRKRQEPSARSRRGGSLIVSPVYLPRPGRGGASSPAEGRREKRGRRRRNDRWSGPSPARRGASAAHDATRHTAARARPLLPAESGPSPPPPPSAPYPFTRWAGRIRVTLPAIPPRPRAPPPPMACALGDGPASHVPVAGADWLLPLQRGGEWRERPSLSPPHRGPLRGVRAK